MSRDNPPRQELILRDDTSIVRNEDKSIPTRSILTSLGAGLGRIVTSVKDYFDETPSGIRRITEKVALHGELYDTTAKTMESLHRLKGTEARLDREDEQAELDHERAKEEKLCDIEQKRRARGRLADEDVRDRARIRDEIDTIKKKNTPPQPDKGKPVNPAVRKAQDLLGTLQEEDRVYQEVKRVKEEIFADIDAEVARGEITAEYATHRKERLEEQIKKRLTEI